MFDFWYEYKYVVPKGYTRFLGKLSELTDMGVEVHYFTGNHDIWAYEYLEKECGVILHKKPETTEIYGKMFFLAHGDGLGDPDKKFKLIKSIFHNKVCQWAFSGLHPRWGMWFKKYIQYHSNVDYFIYGHRHIEVDLQLTKKARMIILGDWITHFTYVVWDGDHLLMSQYIEGESRP